MNLSTASNTYNAARSNQLALEMKRLGVFNDAKGQKIISDHFQVATQNPSNIINNFSNAHGKFEVRESLFIGSSRKASMLEATFQIMPDGTR